MAAPATGHLSGARGTSITPGLCGARWESAGSCERPPVGPVPGGRGARYEPGPPCVPRLRQSAESGGGPIPSEWANAACDEARLWVNKVLIRTAVARPPGPAPLPKGARVCPLAVIAPDVPKHARTIMPAISWRWATSPEPSPAPTAWLPWLPGPLAKPPIGTSAGGGMCRRVPGCTVPTAISSPAQETTTRPSSPSPPTTKDNWRIKARVLEGVVAGADEEVAGVGGGPATLSHAGPDQGQRLGLPAERQGNPCPSHSL